MLWVQKFGDLSITIMAILGFTCSVVAGVVGIFHGSPGIGWSVVVGQLLVFFSVFIYYIRRDQLGPPQENV